MKKFIYAALAFSPILALAQTTVDSVQTSVTSLSSSIITVIKTDIIPVIFALAIVYFFYGLAKFVLAAGDPKKVAEGKGIMIWGIVALVVMAGVYGIINFFLSATGVSNSGTVTLPGGQSF